DTSRYRLVGPDEAEPSRGDISIDSPLARALLKKRVDDEVAVELPSGPRRMAVVDVIYPA
ncbi:MAG TPA: GreA/GreB family elongation factor, partial [Lysobacter sp.]